MNATSIYRRWGDVDTLLEEVAVAVFTRDDEPVPDTGRFAEDLAEWARAISTDIRRPQRTRYPSSKAIPKTTWWYPQRLVRDVLSMRPEPAGMQTADAGLILS